MSASPIFLVHATRSTAVRTTWSQAAFSFQARHGRFRKAGDLGLADPLFHAGVLTVARLESRGLPGHDAGPVPSGVGEDRGDAVSVDVGEGELGAGVGAFLAQDQPVAFGHEERSIMPVASATDAPSRNTSPSPWSGRSAGCQHSSGMASTMRWIRASTGNPKENPTPPSTHAAANAWVAPAESERVRTRGPVHCPLSASWTGRACSGKCGDGHVEDFDVVGGGVRPGIPGPQQAGVPEHVEDGVRDSR